LSQGLGLVGTVFNIGCVIGRLPGRFPVPTIGFSGFALMPHGLRIAIYAARPRFSAVRS
jgi:hypothetical protein